MNHWYFSPMQMNCDIILKSRVYGCSKEEGAATPECSEGGRGQIETNLICEIIFGGCFKLYLLQWKGSSVWKWSSSTVQSSSRGLGSYHVANNQ